ncbi:putative LPS assembly protein LptD [Maribacter hydrothermalis]|uniref:Organic solvent tolerance protein OstA n=1 Tax=Maribacter hydrothermalis TaxID=1836467 RepID=A0A1B7ZD79_9FLAO|nr:putative LPS assembly protein LptD [Maribacter hydrothermalis]APQ18485.1 organic solvent tolerance protein OstA [Maribacter hydrothermalis]OBR41308.1 organic solvent tolerance protein OstA [Maribacter hydrothermalis]
MQSNKQYLLFLFIVFASAFYALAQEDKITPLNIKAERDSITAPLFPATAIEEAIIADSLAKDSLNKKSPLLLDKITYKAKDYVKLSQKENKIYLYNEAEIYYQDTELKAGVIIMDYIKNEVYAGRMKDSLGNYSQLPYFKQGSNIVIPDSIRFNFDTQKALIWNSRTEQQAAAGALGSDAMKVYAEITKKENDSVYFLSEGKLTTSTDTINPDYYIRVRKAKFVPKKKVIAGFSNLYIADVPTPIAMPFAYFPLTVGRSAGILMPSFGNDPNTGYFLQDMGYYVPLGDYADVTLSGDFYTNGSWAVRSASIYTKRYKYRGNFNLRYENQVRSQKGFSDYSLSRNYNIQFSHSQDPKSSPNSRFSASVNLGSSEYYRNSLQQRNLPNTQNNTLSSSISYSKTFPEYPSVNMSLTATHSQLTSPTATTTNADNISMSLPTFQASMERIYPFVKRDGIKKGIIDNINFQYDVNAQNRLTTNDDDFLTSRMFDNAKVGARHRIPVATNFKVAKFFSVSAGGNYEDVWTLETYNKRYDSESETVVTDTIAGFDRYNKYNFSASVGTTLYGTFNFGEDKKIQAVRHTLRPSLSYGYAPSFDQFYDEYLDGDGDVVQFSRFQGTLNGAPSLGKSNSLGFSLANTLEAKVRDKDSTKTEPKKVSLLSNLNISTGYNFESDSLRISPLSINGGTNILDNKMSINFSAGLDPYAIDNNGTRIDTWNIDNGGSLFRLTRANANVSYSISSEMFGKKDEKDKEEEEDPFDYVAQSGGRDDDLFGRADSFNDNPIRKDDKNSDVENPIFGTKIPWNFRLAYSASYNNSARQNEFSSHSLMFSGDIELAPRWSVGGSSGYDFKNQGFTLTQLRFQRDLKSFTMRFNWTPFGEYKRWYFFIGIDSSILKDLKWENRSQN